MLARLFLTVALVLVSAAQAVAKDYHATRFDSRIEVQQGGHLKVTETIVFVFTDTFKKEVFRTIPTRHTDGVEFVSASMDGRVLPAGTGRGQVEVRQKNGLRVTWRFDPVSSSTHTFELSYIARGVVRQDEREELIAWAPLPREHDYTVETSRVDFLLPAEPSGPPRVEERRVDGGFTVEQIGSTMTVLASGIRKNGRLTVSIPLASGTVLDGPPAWQARQAAQREKSPLWLSASGVVVLCCLILLFAMRQNDDHPPRDRGVQWTSLIPPEQLSPAIAGVLVTNGQLQLEHAMATIFALAERGIVTIREEAPGAFGGRNFVIQRTRAGEHLAPHEEAVLDVIFTKASGAEASVSIAKARGYLTSGWSRLKGAITDEMAAAGLTDAGRLAQRRRYMVTGLVLLGIAAVSVVPMFFLVPTHGGWPMVVPVGFLMGGLASFIFMSAHTPLSDEGVRRAEQWRAYKKHLSDPSGVESRWGSSGPAEARILPFAVALGLASAWAKFMKRTKSHTPAWFHPASHADAAPAFSVFIATGGAGAHGGAVSGSGGVAGGGASGAH